MSAGYLQADAQLIRDCIGGRPQRGHSCVTLGPSGPPAPQLRGWLLDCLPMAPFLPQARSIQIRGCGPTPSAGSRLGLIFPSPDLAGGWVLSRLELFAYAWCDLGAEEPEVLHEGRVRHRAHAVFEIKAIGVEDGHGLGDASGDGVW
jgi:hypothetical protein